MNREPDRNPRKALGKGLSALLPSRPAPAPERASAPGPVAVERRPASSEEFQNIPLKQIRPNEEQPRESFDGEKMQELARSIRANGLIQPVTVYKSGPEQYTLIAGERRWRAAEMAGLKEIPAFVRAVEKEQILELALIENIQREDLNPIEIAVAFQRLASEHGLSHERIAERTGKDRSTITNFLRLLKLSARARNELIGGRISVGHARALLNIMDDAAQSRAVEQILHRQLSVRETERLVKDLTTAKAVQPKAPAQPDPNVRAAVQEMEMALGTRVRLVPTKKNAGRLEIEYYSQDDLDRIYTVIVKQ
jgi:ParB family transcriptional regulator, chromosome partitioning protein